MNLLYNNPYMSIAHSLGKAIKKPPLPKVPAMVAI
jgi:hypothetical protein